MRHEIALIFRDKRRDMLVDGRSVVFDVAREHILYELAFEFAYDGTELPILLRIENRNQHLGLFV